MLNERENKSLFIFCADSTDTVAVIDILLANKITAF